MTTKYKIKNLDCAVWAERIETELIKQRDVSKAYVDRVNSTIETDLNDIIRLSRLVKNIEPSAEIEEIKNKPDVSEQKKIRKEIIRISVVVILLLAGL
ncbi:MAG: hypothetical protein EHM47_18115, partial [Ignavibacteriales bacterium]